MVMLSLPHPPHSVLQNLSHLCCFCLEISKDNHLLAQVVKLKDNRPPTAPAHAFTSKLSAKENHI